MTSVCSIVDTALDAIKSASKIEVTIGNGKVRVLDKWLKCQTSTAKAILNEPTYLEKYKA